MQNLDSKAIQQQSLQWRLSRRFKARRQGGSSPNAIWQVLTPLMAMGVLSLPTPAAAQSTLYWSGSGSWDESRWKNTKGSPPSEA